MIFSAASETSASDSSAPEGSVRSGSVKSILSPGASSPSIGLMCPAPMTCANENSVLEKPTSSVEDSPVRTSARLVEAPAWPVVVRDSGGSYYEPFAWYDRSTRSWRTWQRCLIEGWEPWLETWPRSGMTRSGIAYRRAPLVPSTTGIESGSFPTPTRSMGKRGWGFSLTTKERYSRRIIEIAHQYGWRPHCHLLEWLMGLPLGWTDVSEQKPSEMPSSRKSRKSSGER